jgi:oligosaccharide repeat unit polymerase
VLGDFCIAGLPLLGALFCRIAGISSEPILRFLTATLFASSLLLFIGRARRGIGSRQLGQLAILLGFAGWYSFPGMLRVWSESRRFGEELPVFIHNETVLLTVLYLSLFLFVWVLASRVLSRRRQEQPQQREVKPVNPSILLLLAAVACAIGFIPYLTSGLSFSEIVGSVLQSRSVDKPWTYTENLGNSTSVILYVTRSAMIAGASLLLVALQDKRVRIGLRVVAAFVALIITVLLFFDQGTRSLTALMVLPSVVLLFIRLWNRSQARAIGALLIVAVALFFALQFQLLFRASYTRFETSDLMFDDWATLSGTADYFTETAFAVELVPSYHDFFRESALAQFVVSPIPRFLWADKPVTQVAWFYTLMRWGIDIYVDAGNTFPGIVGQYYMSWGALGPIMIAAILAFVSTRTDGFLLRVSPVKDPYSFSVGAMLAVWLLVTYRYLSPGFLYPVAFAAGIVALSKVSLTKDREAMRKRIPQPMTQGD